MVQVSCWITRGGSNISWWTIDEPQPCAVREIPSSKWKRKPVVRNTSQLSTWCSQESLTRQMTLQTIASPGTSGWLGPIEITWRDSVDMQSIPIHCKCIGGWLVLKSIAHGSKCPIQLCLPIDVGRKFCWLMKTCSGFLLYLRDAANEVIQIVHVHM